MRLRSLRFSAQTNMHDAPLCGCMWCCIFLKAWTCREVSRKSEACSVCHTVRTLCQRTMDASKLCLNVLCAWMLRRWAGKFTPKIEAVPEKCPAAHTSEHLRTFIAPLQILLACLVLIYYADNVQVKFLQVGSWCTLQQVLLKTAFEKWCGEDVCCCACCLLQHFCFSGFRCFGILLRGWQCFPMPQICWSLGGELRHQPWNAPSGQTKCDGSSIGCWDVELWLLHSVRDLLHSECLLVCSGCR